MKEKVNLIYNYLERMNNNRPIGSSDYIGLIEMINQEEKIVVELLDNDFEHKYNLLSFLDGGLMALLQNKDNKLNIYDSIVKVLTTWQSLDNKWEISGYKFRKLFERNIF